jgi:hypothetical protein
VYDEPPQLVGTYVVHRGEFSGSAEEVDEGENRGDVDGLGALPLGPAAEDVGLEEVLQIGAASTIIRRGGKWGF